MRIARSCAMLLGLVMSLAVLVASPTSATAKKADLVVVASTMQVMPGAIKGSFTARNAGSKTAGVSWTTIVLRTSIRTVRIHGSTLATIKARTSRPLGFIARLPSGLAPGRWTVTVCLDVNHQVTETSDTNNCRNIGFYTSPTPPSPDDGIPHPAPRSNLVAHVVKKDVIAFTEPYGNYWAYVPTSYDASHQTPTALLVWMHGCGGDGQGDTWTVRPDFVQQGAGLNQHFNYIAISIGGADGGCWNMATGPGLVKAAVYDVQARFNINPRRIILGGYSSGGDLAYRTAFFNAHLFAGVLAINTAPFRDTGSTQAASLAAASWKFHVFQVLHTNDTTYPPSTIVPELEAMKTAGFPVGYVTKPGTHWDNPVGGNYTAGSTPGDIRNYLLPHVDSDNWVSP